MSSFKGFTTVELRKPTRSLFDLSHEKRISFKMGELIPVFISETVPNDTFRCNTEVMLRLAPLLAPIMHRVNCFVHYFFVPNRLLWKEWELFITNGRLGTETPPIPPFVEIAEVGGIGQSLLDNGSLADYLGISPITDAGCAPYFGAPLDLMPFAAYNKVWYDYYRDRNFVADNTFLPMSSGLNGGMIPLDMASILTKRERDYQKDYFTSALPWTQRGNEVLMPLVGSGVVSLNTSSTNAMLLKQANGGATIIGPNTLQADATGNLEAITGSQNAVMDPNGRLTATVDSSGVSINDLRRSIRLQEWLERNALAGSRYNESIMAHFARRTSDARLQRAEYLGGGKVTIKISEIVTTAWSQDGAANDVPPANMAGHGLSFGNTNQFSYNCEEHGFVIGIMSVMPNTAYMQGIPRMFAQRRTFLDYPWPSFAHLGEQPVYKYELYNDTTNYPNSNNRPVFGYQSRYADWKYIPSSSHGDFRTSLDFWHLTRKFSSSPVLGFLFNNFETTLPDRIFAVSGVQTLWAYIYNNVSVKRSLPYYGTPQL